MVTASGRRTNETWNRADAALEATDQARPGAPHLALTVPNASASADWWCRTFGFVPVGPPDYAWPTTPCAALIRHPVSGLVLGFRQRPLGAESRPFEYVSLRVTSERALRDWAEYLDRIGVAHSSIWGSADERYLSFTAPDGIGLELWWVRAG
jgi:glyoxylase I family protein